MCYTPPLYSGSCAPPGRWVREIRSDQKDHNRVKSTKFYAAVAALALLMVVSCGGKDEDDTAANRKARDPDAWKRDNPMQVVMVGPPGAGKGTQAKRIASKYGIPHITTGGIFRDEMSRGTVIGQQVRSVVDRGDLVPDGVVVYLVRQRLQEPDCRKGLILDGFPRTMHQLDSLDVLLAEREHQDVQVFLIEVPDEVLVERLLSRGREDDTEETIKNRLEVYHKETVPLIARFEERRTLVRVNGDQSINRVFREIDNAIVEKWPQWRRE